MYTETEFVNIGKRMPFTVPDGYMEQLQADILRNVRADKPRLGVWQRFRRSFGAASVACLLLLIVGFVAMNLPGGARLDRGVSLDDIEDCFARLSPDDQATYLDLYANDIVLNQIN